MQEKGTPGQGLLLVGGIGDCFGATANEEEEDYTFALLAFGSQTKMLYCYGSGVQNIAQLFPSVQRF